MTAVSNSLFWLNLVKYASVYSPILPLLFIKQAKTPALRLAYAFVLVSFLTDLYVRLFRPSTTVGLFQTYGFVEAAIVFGFYFILLNRKKWIVQTFIIFSIAYWIDAIYLEPGQFNALGSSLESLFIIFLSLRLFYQFFVAEEEEFIYQSPVFWINIGLLVYFSGALFSFVLSSDILDQVRGEIKYSWVFHNFSNTLKNVLLTIGLWKARLK